MHLRCLLQRFTIFLDIISHKFLITTPLMSLHGGVHFRLPTCRDLHLGKRRRSTLSPRSFDPWDLWPTRYTDTLKDITRNHTVMFTAPVNEISRNSLHWQHSIIYLITNGVVQIPCMLQKNLVNRCMILGSQFRGKTMDIWGARGGVLNRLSVKPVHELLRCGRRERGNGCGR